MCLDNGVRREIQSRIVGIKVGLSILKPTPKVEGGRETRNGERNRQETRNKTTLTVNGAQSHLDSLERTQ